MFPLVLHFNEDQFCGNVDVWSQTGSFFTDKLFSKPKNYQPIFRMRDQNGNEKFNYQETSEQFTNMFYNFII